MRGPLCRPVRIVLPLLFGLSACQNTYLGRLTSLRGVDVDDRTRLPLRVVPVATPGAPLPVRRDSGWVARVQPRIGGRAITSTTVLDSVLDANGTRAFLVLHRDTLVDVRYFHGAGPDSLFKSFSISKSILSALS